jgi:hypothetical protein
MDNMSGNPNWYGVAEKKVKTVEPAIIEKLPINIDTTEISEIIGRYKTIYTNTPNKHLGDAILYLTNCINCLNKLN